MGETHTSFLGWTSWHDRLHRRLLLQPQLLPKGSALLLAVSGGQDSMALLALLQDLAPLHGWTLSLWHGDHSWHDGSRRIAAELSAWCQQQQLPLLVDQAAPGQVPREARARQWRYERLEHHAREAGADVVTGHTASDRAEGVVMNLARGCDIQGLSNLRDVRPISTVSADGPRLRRPLLQFTRADTANICRGLQLPIWLDPSNADQSLERNRIRHQVMPVLDELHPGCERRMANLSERVSQLRDTQTGLCDLALQHLSHAEGLDRQAFRHLNQPTCRALLAEWLRRAVAPHITSKKLEDLSHRLRTGPGSGQSDLGSSWQMQWNRSTIRLLNPATKP